MFQTRAYKNVRYVFLKTKLLLNHGLSLSPPQHLYLHCTFPFVRVKGHPYTCKIFDYLLEPWKPRLRNTTYQIEYGIPGI